MKPIVHCAVSVVVSSVLYYATQSATIAGVSFLSGFLVDIDHFPDYFREYGFHRNHRDFFHIFHETRFKKLWLFFHAWEWVLILFLCAALFDRNEVVLGMLIGMIHHLTLDQIGNGATAGGYFIICRAGNRFATEAVIRGEFLERRRRNGRS